MIVERHNLACNMIMKATSNTGPLASCFVSMDTGSSKRLTKKHLQISKKAENRVPIPKLSDQIIVNAKYDSRHQLISVEVLGLCVQVWIYRTGKSIRDRSGVKYPSAVWLSHLGGLPGWSKGIFNHQ